MIVGESTASIPAFHSSPSSPHVNGEKVKDNTQWVATNASALRLPFVSSGNPPSPLLSPPPALMTSFSNHSSPHNSPALSPPPPPSNTSSPIFYSNNNNNLNNNNNNNNHMLHASYYTAFASSVSPPPPPTSLVSSPSPLPPPTYLSTNSSPRDIYMNNMNNSSYTVKYHDSLISSSSYAHTLFSFNDKKNFASSLNALIFSLRTIIEEEDEKKPPCLKLLLSERQNNDRNTSSKKKHSKRHDNHHASSQCTACIHVPSSSPLHSYGKTDNNNNNNTHMCACTNTHPIAVSSDAEKTHKKKPHGNDSPSPPPSPDYSSENTLKSEDGGSGGGRNIDTKDYNNNSNPLEYLPPPVLSTSSPSTTYGMYSHHAHNSCYYNSNNGIICNSARIIVMSFDMSARCKKEIEWCRKHILKPNDTLVLIHVAQDILSIEQTNQLKSPGMILVTKKELAEYNESEFEKIKKKMRQVYDAYLFDCDVYPVIVPLCKNSKASIGSILCTFGRELYVDMIAVGYHSRHFDSVRQFFFGSISKYVFDHSSCPVVTVKV